MQALLGRTIWDQERARDICRDYVMERLGDPSGDLVLDETGFLKKGSHSAGVARQYSGTVNWRSLWTNETIVLAAAACGIALATGASVMPLNSLQSDNSVDQVRMVCDEYGRC
jgi:hypothetical protein